MKKIRTITVNLLALTIASGITIQSFAKLPDPSPEAKAAAALAAAKTAHGDKVAAYQLCLSQDRVAKRFATKPQPGEKAIEVPPCKDPGKFEPPAELAAAVPAPAAPAAPVKK